LPQTKGFLFIFSFGDSQSNYYPIKPQLSPYWNISFTV